MKAPKKSPKDPNRSPTAKSRGATPAREAEPALIRCRRVEATYTVEEHKDCPYCFGKEADIQGGDHRKFCDYKPGEDPICFGFPEGFGRYGTK